MKLSIVATLYQSAPHIKEFYTRASKVAVSMAGDDYEIILVNDGSPDNSLEIAMALSEIDSHVYVIDLSRNFGHHKAMMTGLAHAGGEKIFLIDSDLEEEPELLTAFSTHQEANDCDVVYGVQGKRKGGITERWSGQLFYILFRALTGVQLPSNIVTARLMTRRYVTALLKHTEREVFMAGLWHITGFNQEPLTITKHNLSKTTYTLKSKIAIFVDSITSFSNTPLISIFYIGVLIFMAAGTYNIYLVVNWFMFSNPPNGWTSIMASIWLLGGLVISFIGIIGIYLSKIFSETKQRPYTIIRQTYGTKRAEEHE